MGKTSKPLTIVALPPCDGWEELDKLEKQGHKVIRPASIEGDYPASVWKDNLINADIVLGSNCWRMDHQHKSYLTLALKESRMIRYKSHEDRADTKKRASAAADVTVEPSTDS
jgi:hypothetical protein